MSNVTAQTAPMIAAAVRSGLHCVSPTDPRLAVQDSKQKGPAGGRGRLAAEARVVRELGAALLGSEAACSGFLKAVAAVAGAARCRVVRRRWGLRGRRLC
jgi:hypothetical protein